VVCRRFFFAPGESGFRIWRRNAFERSSLIMTLGNPAAISCSKLVGRAAELRPVRRGSVQVQVNRVRDHRAGRAGRGRLIGRSFNVEVFPSIRTANREHASTGVFWKADKERLKNLHVACFRQKYTSSSRIRPKRLTVRLSNSRTKPSTVTEKPASISRSL